MSQGDLVIRDADIADPLLADYRDLKDVSLRKVMEPEHGLFIAESKNVIGQALRAGYVPRSLLIDRDRLVELEDLRPWLGDDVPILTASQDLLRQITGFTVHRGFLASMRRKPARNVEEIVAGARRLVVLESIVDHTNVGAILRSAAGLGWDGVLIDDACADPLYRRSVRVSMGAALTLPWTRVQPWPALPDLLDGFTVMALTPDASATDLAQLAVQPSERIALVFGTEGAGLSAMALAMVDQHVRIPMHAGIDSLNVGAAAAIGLWQLRG